MAAVVNGDGSVIFPALVDGSTNAIEVAMGLAAFLSVWCGIMRLAEKSGLLDAMAKLVLSLFEMAFPNLSPNHKAWAPMIMNVSTKLPWIGKCGNAFWYQSYGGIV